MENNKFQSGEMVRKGTLGDVSRELLERLIDAYACHDNNPHCHLGSDQEAIDELRALLEAPAKKRPAWMDEPFAVAARGEERGSSHGFEQSPNTCRHDERSGVWWREGSITRTGRECCACGSLEEDPIEPAAQHQGEPVAWHTDDHLTDKSATTYDRAVMERWKAKGWPVNQLYAEQPAPVAVVMPERRPEIVSEDPALLMAVATWNACIDEMKRLNSTRPAHASPPPGAEPIAVIEA